MMGNQCNEMTAAFLYAQLEQSQKIQNKRIGLWNRYYEELKELEVLGLAKMPVMPDYASGNGHAFYLTVADADIQSRLGKYLKQMGVATGANYDLLYEVMYHGEFQYASHHHMCIIKLPMYADLTPAEQKTVINKIWRFFLHR
jgi:dTDP-4-amino-4,6-dideoxygalactose transaminase